jgi:hypothetical protein
LDLGAVTFIWSLQYGVLEGIFVAGRLYLLTFSVYPVTWFVIKIDPDVQTGFEL